eukprot:scaffold358132_cov52-Attheya_sp.AAC.1
MSNLDLYFLKVVKHLTVTPGTASRNKPALQWFADYREHIGLQFKVDSISINQSLFIQRQQYKKDNSLKTGRKRTVNVADDDDDSPLPDPFAHLPTNVVDWEDMQKAIYFENAA